jgi:membrane-associated phospholipid phosphatase
MASLVAFERVYSDKHWTSDVFLGAAIGYFVAKDIVKKDNKNNSLSIYPLNNGIMIAFRI